MMDDPPTNINDLPDEILLQVFSYLSTEDIGLNVQFVCTRWSEICTSDVLWKNTFLSIEQNATHHYAASVLKKCPKLQCFYIWFSPSTEVLNSLSEYCKDLRKLVFCVPKLECSNDAFKNLVLECTKIEELTLPGCALAREEIAQLVGQWTKLKIIYLIGISDQPVILKHLADGCPSLQHLHMRSVKYTYSEMEYFLNKKKDKLLSLSLSPNSRDDLCVIPLLEICSEKLEKLHLEDSKYCFIDSENLSVIKTLTSLKYLSLRIPRGVTPDVMSSVFEQMAMSQLLELDLNNYTGLNDAIVHVICNNCPNLLKLALRYSTHLNDDGLKYLYKCASLEELDLYYCTEVTDAAIDYILSCSNLKYLNLGFCKLTKKSLICLTVLSKLRELVLDACDVDGLPLELFPLYLRNLRKLKLDYCFNIDNEAVAALQTAMPHLKVSTRQAERCP